MTISDKSLIQFPDASDLSVDQKIKVLEIGYKQFASELEYTEQLEHKVTVAASSIVVILAGLIVQQKIDTSGIVSLLFASICIGFSILASLFLRQLGERKQLLYAGLLRVEQIFGLFKPNNYVSDEYVEQSNGVPHPESSVFATKGLHSGFVGVDENTKWHVITVIFSGIVSSLIILSEKFL
jgi:hypothetical protein